MDEIIVSPNRFESGDSYRAESHPELNCIVFVKIEKGKKTERMAFAEAVGLRLVDQGYALMARRDDAAH